MTVYHQSGRRHGWESLSLLTVFRTGGMLAGRSKLKSLVTSPLWYSISLHGSLVGYL